MLEFSVVTAPMVVRVILNVAVLRELNRSNIHMSQVARTPATDVDIDSNVGRPRITRLFRSLLTWHLTYVVSTQKILNETNL